YLTEGGTATREKGGNRVNGFKSSGLKASIAELEDAKKHLPVAGSMIEGLQGAVEEAKTYTDNELSSMRTTVRGVDTRMEEMTRTAGDVRSQSEATARSAGEASSAAEHAASEASIAKQEAAKASAAAATAQASAAKVMEVPQLAIDIAE